MKKLKIVLPLLLLINFISCSLIRSKDQIRMDTGYKILNAMQVKDYEKVKSLFCRYDDFPDDTILKYYVDNASQVLKLYGAPSKDQVIVDKSNPQFVELDFPIHVKKDKYNISSAKIYLLFGGACPPTRATNFRVIVVSSE